MVETAETQIQEETYEEALERLEGNRLVLVLDSDKGRGKSLADLIAEAHYKPILMTGKTLIERAVRDCVRDGVRCLITELDIRLSLVTIAGIVAQEDKTLPRTVYTAERDIPIETKGWINTGGFILFRSQKTLLDFIAQ